MKNTLERNPTRRVGEADDLVSQSWSEQLDKG